MAFELAVVMVLLMAAVKESPSVELSGGHLEILMAEL